MFLFYYISACLSNRIYDKMLSRKMKNVKIRQKFTRDDKYKRRKIVRSYTYINNSAKILLVL